MDDHESMSVSVSSGKLLSSILLSNDEIDKICKGYIGMGRHVFCTKLGCSVASHAINKFNPTPDMYYVCKTPEMTSAWCNLCFSEVVVKQEILAGNTFDISKPRPLDDWKRWISTLPFNDSVKLTDHMNTLQDSDLDSKTITSIKDPKSMLKPPFTDASSPFASDVCKDGSYVPAFKTVKFETGYPTVEALDNLEDSGIKSILEMFYQDIDALSSDLTDTIKRSESIQDIESQLTALLKSFTSINQLLGSNVNSNFKTVWSGLDELWTSINLVDTQVLQEDLHSATFDIINLKDSETKTQGYWNTLGTTWLPRISNLESAFASLKSKLNEQQSSINARLRHSSIDSMLQGNSSNLSNQNSKATHSNFNPVANPNSNDHQVKLEIDSLKRVIDELKQQVLTQESNIEDLQTLKEDNSVDGWHTDPHSQSKLGHTGVSYRQFYFKDPEYLESWLKKHMTHPSHGLFVDLVSFSEFFGGERYIERNTTLNQVYMSSKIGYSTITDSIVANSFQNVLPGAYGRPSSTKPNDELELVSQAELPGMPTFAKWDNRDGSNGRRFWIREETRKTEQQLDGIIRSQLSGPAQILAKDLLMDSVSMSESLYTFISTSYEDTMHSGRFDTQQAWTLTSCFVKRIFQELSYERVVARDGIQVGDHWSTAAKFIFATLRAHTVMSEFMKLSIKDHPSISSEMVKFVCYSQPSADASELLTRLNGVESMQRADQSNISKLDSRLKKTEGWKADSDKLLKKLKEKTGI